MLFKRISVIGLSETANNERYSITIAMKTEKSYLLPIAHKSLHSYLNYRSPNQYELEMTELRKAA